MKNLELLSPLYQVTNLGYMVEIVKECKRLSIDDLVTIEPNIM